MKATKEITITVRMSISEAEALMHCNNKALTDGSYRDVLPDDKRTKKSLESFVDKVSGLV